MRSAAAYNADMNGVARSAKFAWSATAARVPPGIAPARHCASHGRASGRRSGVEHQDLAAVAGHPDAMGRRLERDPDRVRRHADRLHDAHVGRAELRHRVRLVVDDVERRAVGRDRHAPGLRPGCRRVRRRRRVVGVELHDLDCRR